LRAGKKGAKHVAGRTLRGRSINVAVGSTSFVHRRLIQMLVVVETNKQTTYYFKKLIQDLTVSDTIIPP